MSDRRIDWAVWLRSYARDPVSNVGMYQQHCSALIDEDVTIEMIKEREAEHGNIDDMLGRRTINVI